MTDFTIPADHPCSPANRAPTHVSPIDALCSGIVEALKSKLVGSVKIEHFPNNPSEYDFEGSDAAVLVIYGGSKFDDSGPRGGQGMHEEVAIEICLLVRSLRGYTGAYGLIHEIRTALHGASIAGSTGLCPDLIELQSENEGVYQFQIKFDCTLVAVPMKPTGVALPNSFAARR